MNSVIEEYLRNHGGGEQVQATPGQQTMSRVQQMANRLVTCSLCGSDWLFEINLQQYRPGYSAGAGGDLQPMSEGPQTVRMCPCGNVIGPTIGGVKGGHTPNTILNGLLGALSVAAERRDGVVKRLTMLSTAAADKSDLEALKERVAVLEEPSNTQEASGLLQGVSLDPVDVVIPDLEGILARIRNLEEQLAVTSSAVTELKSMEAFKCAPIPAAKRGRPVGWRKPPAAVERELPTDEGQHD